MRYSALKNSDRENPALGEEVLEKIPASGGTILPCNATRFDRDILVALCTLILIAGFQWAWKFSSAQEAPVLGMCIQDRSLEVGR